MSELVIEDLYAEVVIDESQSKEILKGVSLSVKSGEVHAIMGPNGSGKSSLAAALMGHPKYHITAGSVVLDGENLNDLTADKRAKLGLFLGMQYPTEIPGVSLTNFLRASKSALATEKFDVRQYVKDQKDIMGKLGIEHEFSSRSINVGFSGGEKKRAEILQLELLKPKIAILDETDSGLDIDALRIVSEGINRSVLDNNTGIILITHYARILQYLTPARIHVFRQGRIIESGGMEIAMKLEDRGYSDFANS